MPDRTTDCSHVLLVPFAAFGHTRPVSAVAARLVLEKENVVLTFFATPHQIEQVRKDISNQFPESLISSDVKEKALKRIRVVTTFKSTDSNDFHLSMSSSESYPAAYETLYRGRPFTCATTGEVFDAVPPPVAVVIDLCALPQLQATRAISGTSVPIIAILPGPSSSFIRCFAPPTLGGIGLGKTLDDEAARLGVSPDELGNKLYKHTEGKIIKIAGLPDMYDYEFFPQKLPFETFIVAILRGACQFVEECDGVLIPSSHSYEDASLNQMKSWFKTLPQNPLPLFAVGPLLPPGYGRHSIERPESEKSRGERDVQAFLEEMQAKHGERSVVFISFGTVFWPSAPGYIDEVINALIDKGVPFILCLASPFVQLSEEFLNNVKASGLGLMTTWAPQQYVLNHPATGWFLTHAGNGGVTESLGSGVPMICWPFAIDQPTISAHLSCNLKVAFELVEVRTGSDGSQPMLRNGRAPKGTREAVGEEFRQIIDACRGEQGEELRRNAKEFQRKFEKAWEEGGEAKQELKAFLARFVL
ncbi:glycosyltransferase family 1 protein [Hebeloma cylindrosporum]|uniref:Glycosyltransferase family 1 protein n=1 Tax=Hebeloma cylindrosporum TaxID=76867 RepID=A0A0C2XMQ1_HEBCY|nr:glycosyltransferase family 1 protein [Hebeloma cylindrosporum h7]